MIKILGSLVAIGALLALSACSSMDPHPTEPGTNYYGSSTPR